MPTARIVLATAVIVATTLFPSVAMAEAECPVESREIDGIVKAIQAAPTCRASLDVMTACAFTASGDVALGGAQNDGGELAENKMRRNTFFFLRDAHGRS